MADNEEQNREDTNAAPRKKKRRWLWILLLFIVAAAVILRCVFCGNCPCCGNGKTQCKHVDPPSGEKFEFSEFYHAKDGTWIIYDDNILVLKERKYISDSEVDEYSVHKITPQDKVKIISADTRWKEAEIIQDAKVIACGWIDATHTRKVKRVEDKELQTKPVESQKAMKQLYPH